MILAPSLNRTTDACPSLSRKAAAKPKPQVEAAVDNSASSPVESTTADKVVVYANDVKNVKTRRKMLSWFRKSK